MHQQLIKLKHSHQNNKLNSKHEGRRTDPFTSRPSGRDEGGMHDSNNHQRTTTSPPRRDQRARRGSGRPRALQAITSNPTDYLVGARDGGRRDPWRLKGRSRGGGSHATPHAPMHTAHPPHPERNACDPVKGSGAQAPAACMHGIRLLGPMIHARQAGTTSPQLHIQPPLSALACLSLART